jgi:hypothetical protein
MKSKLLAIFITAIALFGIVSSSYSKTCSIIFGTIAIVIIASLLIYAIYYLVRSLIDDTPLFK